MLLCIPDLLSPEKCAALRARIEAADWVDGRITAGAQSALAKKNTQLREDDPVARAASDAIVDALAQNALFLSAALPARIFPPLFNRYGPGDRFGAHVDNAIRAAPGAPVRIRTDLSMTIFLSDPSSYDGGELVIETKFGAQEIKLEAGAGVLYPASSLHRVNEITSGVRLAAFFWVQSMVRDDGEREMLFDLDQSIQRLAAERGHEDSEVITLTGIYHNLVRRWALT